MNVTPFPSHYKISLLRVFSKVGMHELRVIFCLLSFHFTIKQLSLSLSRKARVIAGT